MQKNNKAGNMLVSLVIFIFVLFSISEVAEAAKNPWIVSINAIQSCSDANLVQYEIVLKEIYADFSNDHPVIEIGGKSYALDNKRVGKTFIFKHLAKRNSTEKFRYRVSFSTPATSVTYFALANGSIVPATGEQKDFSMNITFPDTPPFCQKAQEYFDRIVLALEGDLMLYVNFPFQVPKGNCGQVEVRKFQQSLDDPLTPGSWKLLAPGNMAKSKGIYWFRSKKSNCSPAVKISGQPFDSDVRGQWTGMKVKPEDLGLLSITKNYGKAYRLSRDLSYIIVFNPHGGKTNLGAIINDPDAFNLHCESAGVILPNQRGFLHRAFMWREMNTEEQNAFLRNTFIDRDEVFVNICH